LEVRVFSCETGLTFEKYIYKQNNMAKTATRTNTIHRIKNSDTYQTILGDKIYLIAGTEVIIGQNHISGSFFVSASDKGVFIMKQDQIDGEVTMMDRMLGTLKAKNVSFEYRPEDEVLGVCLTKHVWHWFSISEGNNFMMFDHTYSQNTGRTQKGTKRSFDVTNHLVRVTGIDWYEEDRERRKNAPLSIPDYITIIVDYKEKPVATKDYLEAKTKQLIDFGYTNLTLMEVQESVIKVWNKKPLTTVIDHMVHGDIKLPA
jgi:hypothetical protein